jgi:hypothetical protein
MIRQHLHVGLERMGRHLCELWEGSKTRRKILVSPEHEGGDSRLQSNRSASRHFELPSCLAGYLPIVILWRISVPQNTRIPPSRGPQSFLQTGKTSYWTGTCYRGPLPPHHFHRLCYFCHKSGTPMTLIFHPTVAEVVSKGASEENGWKILPPFPQYCRLSFISYKMALAAVRG